MKDAIPYILLAVIAFVLGYYVAGRDVQPEVVTVTQVDTVQVAAPPGPPTIITKTIVKADTAEVNKYREQARQLLADKEAAEERVAELMTPVTETFPFEQKGVTGTATITYQPTARSMMLNIDVVTIPQINVNTTTTIYQKPAPWVKPVIAVGAAATVLLAQEKSYGWAIGTGAATIGLITLEF